MSMQLCFATNNQHKIEEVRAMLGSAFELRTLHEIGCYEDIPETGETMEANSLLKAQYVWEQYGINCFADDSGLEVAALGGAPGVYSARYAGQHGNHLANNQLLLSRLEGQTERSAQFRAVITLILEGQTHQFEGVVGGRIVSELRGTDGFGYDPLFVPTGYEQTFAEMAFSEKNKFSHRAKAVEKLCVFLAKDAADRIAKTSE